jgi:predicted PhzF superfamily epimerase YddE/YHI9
MSQNSTQVDSFTRVPFKGNPAAVCVTGAGEDRWMQHVARKMHLAETAFLHRQQDGFTLRWLPPTAEVDICGHATLASAHVLWEEEYLRPDEPARFHTRSGLPTATKAPDGLAERLGVAPLYVGRSRFDFLAELDSEETLSALKPNLALIERISARGVIVTSHSAMREYDFLSRFVAPQSGINEDPVTGSAHCTLTPFWAERLNKCDLSAHQASPRGGEPRVRMNGERALIAGQTSTVLRCALLVRYGGHRLRGARYPDAPRATPASTLPLQ